MSNINYFSSIVKVLENPKIIYLKEKITAVEYRVELPQNRGSKILFLSIRGKLIENILNYYNINDYILIEGYLSIKENQNSKKDFKKIEVSILKIYPLYLDSNK